MKILFTTSSYHSNLPLISQWVGHTARSRVWPKRIFLPDTQKALSNQLSLTESVHCFLRSPSTTQIFWRRMNVHDNKPKRQINERILPDEAPAFIYQFKHLNKSANQQCLNAPIGHHKCMTLNRACAELSLRCAGSNSQSLCSLKHQGSRTQKIHKYKI